MDSGSTESQRASEPLTDEQRAAVFAQLNTGVGRDGLDRIVRPPIPQKFVKFVIAVFVVLGLGGVAVEHFFGGIGTTGSTSTLSLTATTTTSPSTAKKSAPHFTAALQVFMGLKEIATATAPPIALKDQAGQMWNLGAQRGKVVVLTFFDQTCNDICLVEGQEIRMAQLKLATMAASTEFVIINSDPDHLRFTPTPLALRTPKLLALPSVFFLNGSLTQLNSVWVRYGISVRVGRRSGQTVHNNVMYFIDPRGKLRALVVPFAYERRNGTLTLKDSDVQRFARGLTAEAISLAK
jgi:cytochrome oxidase Cu insertion factor (SCO1/SenC/PrrC family)